jgi:hypothetical protein
LKKEISDKLKIYVQKMPAIGDALQEAFGLTT